MNLKWFTWLSLIALACVSVQARFAKSDWQLEHETPSEPTPEVCPRCTCTLRQLPASKNVAGSSGSSSVDCSETTYQGLTKIKYTLPSDPSRHLRLIYVEVTFSGHPSSTPIGYIDGVKCSQWSDVYNSAKRLFYSPVPGTSFKITYKSGGKIIEDDDVPEPGEKICSIEFYAVDPTGSCTAGSSPLNLYNCSTQINGGGNSTGESSSGQTVRWRKYNGKTFHWLRRTTDPDRSCYKAIDGNLQNRKNSRCSVVKAGRNQLASWLAQIQCQATVTMVTVLWAKGAPGSNSIEVFVNDYRCTRLETSDPSLISFQCNNQVGDVIRVASNRNGCQLVLCEVRATGSCVVTEPEPRNLIRRH